MKLHKKNENSRELNTNKFDFYLGCERKKNPDDSDILDLFSRTY